MKVSTGIFVFAAGIATLLALSVVLWASAEVAATPPMPSRADLAKKLHGSFRRHGGDAEGGGGGGEYYPLRNVDDPDYRPPDELDEDPNHEEAPEEYDDDDVEADEDVEDDGAAASWLSAIIGLGGGAGGAALKTFDYVDVDIDDGRLLETTQKSMQCKRRCTNKFSKKSSSCRRRCTSSMNKQVCELSCSIKKLNCDDGCEATYGNRKTKRCVQDAAPSKRSCINQCNRRSATTLLNLKCRKGCATRHAGKVRRCNSGRSPDKTPRTQVPQVPCNTKTKKSCWDGLKEYFVVRKRSLGCEYPDCECDEEEDKYHNKGSDRAKTRVARDPKRGCTFPPRKCVDESRTCNDGEVVRTLRRELNDDCNVPDCKCVEGTEACWNGVETIQLEREVNNNCKFRECECATDTRECYPDDKNPVTQFRDLAIGCDFPECTCDEDTQPFNNGLEVIQLKRDPAVGTNGCDFPEGECAGDTEPCWNGLEHLEPLVRDFDNSCQFPSCPCADDEKLCNTGVDEPFPLYRNSSRDCTFPPCTCAEGKNFWNGLTYQELIRNPEDHCDFPEVSCAIDSDPCFDGQDTTEVHRVLDKNCSMDECPPCLDDQKRCWDGVKEHFVNRTEDGCLFPACPPCAPDNHTCWNGDVLFRNPDTGCSLEECPPCVGEVKICFDGEQQHVLEIDQDTCKFLEDCPACIADTQECWDNTDKEITSQVRVKSDDGTSCDFPYCDSANLCFTGTSHEVTTACEHGSANCCTSPDPDNSPACLWDGVGTVCTGSCQGKYACYTTGADTPPLMIGPNSCRGDGSCASNCAAKTCPLLVPPAISIGSGSCLGMDACELAWKVGNDSCFGSNACVVAACVGDQKPSCSPEDSCPGTCSVV